MNFTPGLVSITFRKLDPQQIVELVARAKLRAIEWGGDVHVPHGDLGRAKQVRAMTHDAGLQTVCYGSYYRAGEPVSERNPDFKSVLDSAIDLAAPVIRVWPGVVGSSSATPDDRGRVVGDLQRICELAEPHGIRIATEFHANTLTDTADSAIDLIRQVNHANLRTLWQPPNGLDTEACLAGFDRVRDHVEHIHAFHWWPTASDRHPLSEGRDRWQRFIDRFHALQCTPLPILLEFVKADSPEQFNDDAKTLIEWIENS